jgi:lipopolysaccharide biosynthesis regulator YciM
MRSLLLFFSCLFSFWVSAQNDQLALDYFEKGEFEKAVTLYEEIYTKQPTNLFFFEKLLHCYRQLQQFDKAENLMKSANKNTTNLPCKLNWDIISNYKNNKIKRINTTN